MMYGDLEAQLTVQLKMTTMTGDHLLLHQLRNKIHFQVHRSIQVEDGDPQVMISLEELGRPPQVMANRIMIPLLRQLQRSETITIFLGMDPESTLLQWAQLMEKKHLFGSWSVCV